MRLTARQSGIISYAGLDKDALWTAAKRAFARTDEPLPERFQSLLPIFPVELVVNMSYIGARSDNVSPVSPQGFSISPVEYHQRLWEELPELYSEDNYRRNFNYDGKLVGRGAMTVDRAWATRFPQYQAFLGERLYIYMIGGGHQAVAVPESVYPRGGELLRNSETELRITARCEHYVSYLKRRLAAGEKYNPAVFETDYLRINELLPIAIYQSELGRVMQDLSIIRSLKGERPSQRLFTENAKRAEGIAQYVPFRCACDYFAEEPVTRATARLAQLCYEDEDISDMWLPYQDASEYIDKRRMAIDVAALCRGFQLAPEHDPITRGGRYPTRARVVVVRDRELRLLVADTINNPAYGSGMSPLGMMNRLVYLPESRELIRRGKLSCEEAGFTCENAEVSPEDYRQMVLSASAQELKGRLIDAMYRRESALSQMQEGTPAYDRAMTLLNARVGKLENAVAALGAQSRRGQLSGYDADIDYLRRMAQSREGALRDDAEEPTPFVPDALREQSIESGYAMRNCVKYVGLGAVDAAKENEQTEATREDSEDASAPKAQEAAEAPASAPIPEVKTNESKEQKKTKKDKKAPSHPPEIKNAPIAEPETAAVKASKAPDSSGRDAKRADKPHMQFEQLRMFGMEAIAPKSAANADKGLVGGSDRPAMANVAARGKAVESYQSENPDGSMARLVNKKRK